MPKSTITPPPSLPSPWPHSTSAVSAMALTVVTGEELQRLVRQVALWQQLVSGSGAQVHISGNCVHERM